MDSDRQRWDQRFSTKALQAPKVPRFFQQQLPQLPAAGARVLDVASGDGAVALWFATQGFEVSALDISSVALARLQTFAQQQATSIDCICEDLDDVVSSGKVVPEAFDVIVMAHFKPTLNLLERLSTCLRPAGQMLLTTFNQLHHEKQGFSERFCLSPHEFEHTIEGLQCVHYQSVEHNGSCMDEYRWLRTE